MTGQAEHFCPACGAPQRAFLRYPWHVCNDCRDRVTDGAGRALGFGNTAMSGGFAWWVVGEDARTECRGAVCLLLGRPVLVHEARFGGVVVEPAHSEEHWPDGYWNLTRADPMPPRKR